jgi:hypothetical protein
MRPGTWFFRRYEIVTGIGPAASICRFFYRTLQETRADINR